MRLTVASPINQLSALRRIANEACQRAFVETMARVADGLARLEYHEQRIPFFLFGASFHFALQIAGNFKVDWDFVALTQSIAAFAQNSRDFARPVGCSTNSRSMRQSVQMLNGGRRVSPVGRVAEELHDFETARDWYLKSLAIEEQQGNLHGAARTYHQLGRIAEEQRDFETAREWYLKSLAIEEQQGNLSGPAPITSWESSPISSATLTPPASRSLSPSPSRSSRATSSPPQPPIISWE